MCGLEVRDRLNPNLIAFGFPRVPTRSNEACDASKVLVRRALVSGAYRTFAAAVELIEQPLGQMGNASQILGAHN